MMRVASDGTSEIGRIQDIPLAVFSLVRSGTAYDLSSGWWTGMPLADGHPPFQVITYRTPQGERLHRDLPFLEDNKVGFGFISELLMMTAHAGTHVDALCHITCGPNDEWHGGRRAADGLGDFGALSDDAASLAPMLGRGVLLDVPAAIGVEKLDAHQPIGTPELQATVERARVDLRPGDIVLLRTGTMGSWPNREAMEVMEGAGLSLEGAEWLMGHDPAAIGSDTAAVEVAPSGLAGDPQPVHRYVIKERGVPLLEWVYLESLSADDVSEFLFICLPLPIRGATGSPVRPIALV